jgi:putative ABC transport system permease protein
LSIALTFASVSLKGTLENLYKEQLQKYFGTANIVVHADENSPSNYFRVKDVGDTNKLIEYQVDILQLSGSYSDKVKDKNVSLDIKAYDYEELELMNPITIIEELNDEFVGKDIIIGTLDAEELGLKLGDTISININNSIHKFRVSKIGASDGLLRPSRNQVLIVMPKATAGKILDKKGLSNSILIKSNEGVVVSEVIESLQLDYKRYDVREPISQEEIDASINSIIVPFILMLTLVVVTSVFIIYTAFKVIVTEKLPILGTFRSIGATKRKTDIVLLTESFLYGLVGGVIGIGLGILVLKGITTIMADDPYAASKLKVEMAYGAPQILFALGMSVVLSVLSALAPILKISKIALRDVVLGNIESKYKKKTYKYFIGLLLVIISFVLPQMNLGSVSMIINIACLLILCVGVVFLVPLFTDFMLIILDKVITPIFGNIGFLGVKNIKDNKSILNNISLLTLGIAGILMINIVSYSVGVEVLDVYNSAEFDIWYYEYGNDRDTEQRIKTVEGVEDTLGVYNTYGIKIKNTDYEIGSLFGINPYEYFDYWNFPIVGDKDEIIKNVVESRSIILSTMIRDKFDYNVGDDIILEFDKSDQVYKIAGFTNTLMNNGSMAMISEGYLKKDARLKFYDDIYIKTSIDPNVVQEALEKKFSRSKPWMSTLNDLQVQNMEANEQIFMLLRGFSFVAMIIGIFGILNNFIVSMLSRKRNFAMMRSVGMSKVQTIKMLSIEAICSGLVGGIAGVISGVAFLIITGFILKAMDMPVGIHYPLNMLIIGVISGSVISLLSNLLPSFKTSKMNIIEAIKYE